MNVIATSLVCYIFNIMTNISDQNLYVSRYLLKVTRSSCPGLRYIHNCVCTLDTCHLKLD